MFNSPILKSKKVFVTGGSGFVGLALVQRLVQQGVKVVASGRNHSSDVEKAGAEMVCGDIRNRNFLVEASKGCNMLFHVAAKAGIWGTWQDYYSINVEGTKNAIMACKENNITTLVYTSTPSVVFDRVDITGGDESLPYSKKFLCHYAKSKCLAEIEVLAANKAPLQTVSLRPHLIWGPGDTNLIPRLLERGASNKLKQVGNGKNRVDISYIENVIDAHIQAAYDLETDGRSAGKSYFISQGEPVYLWDWINDLFSRLDIPQIHNKVSFNKAFLVGALMEIAYKILMIKKEPMMTRFLAEQLSKSHWFSIDNAKRDFGYSPQISTEKGTKRLLESLNS